MVMTKYSRADNNADEIVDVLVQLGCRVTRLTNVGGGVPDLLVCTGSRDLCLIEVKQPGQNLRPNQVVFAKTWPVWVVHTVDEAIRAYNHTIRGVKP